MTSDEYRKRYYQTRAEVTDVVRSIDNNIEAASQLSNIASNTGSILDDLDDKFCQATRLTKMDAVLLFVAIGLQIARQYILTRAPERLDDQSAAENTMGHVEEHSNRIHRYYNPSLIEIITNPVPFDANIGANGALAGGGKMGHRVTAIGHDPILGLIFGTANIATSTLTTSSFESYHVYTNQLHRDFLMNRARTDLVIKYAIDKLINQGGEGRIIIGCSFTKEVIHLRSDLYTKHSLPLPIISAIDPKMASTLASYGFDMANVKTVGKQAGVAVIINTLIAMLHYLLRDGNNGENTKLYEVRTRKILSYSNLIATSSNLAIVGITYDMSKLDLGGLAVTIYRLITDSKFINEMKKEFVYGSYQNMIDNIVIE